MSRSVQGGRSFRSAGVIRDFLDYCHRDARIRPDPREGSEMAIRGRRIRDASGRLVFAPARAVTASAGERLESELERAADAILSGPFPEALARSVIEHHVLERAVAQMAE